MTVSVAMYDKSYEHIRTRLDALGLDIVVRPFCKDGMFVIDGAKVAPKDVSVDYMWLSSHINTDGYRDGAFDLVLGCKSIGVVQTFNAGMDYPVYKQIANKGTRICNSTAQGVAIAEYVFGQALSVLQPIEFQRELQAKKLWKQTGFREIWRTYWLIIGFGPIGQEVAKRAKAFDATTAVIRRTAQASPLADSVGTMADLEKFLPAADVIVMACPLNAETRGFAGKSFFDKVKKGAMLINIARGPLIDDAAMLAALDDGRLGTAVLDVFHQEPLPSDDPLWSHPKVRMTSHTSFAGSGGRARWDALFLDNIQRFCRGEALANEVDPASIT